MITCGEVNKSRLNTCLVIFLSLSISSSAQELSYLHYNTKDGLAGSTVYDICQDKDGFIWIATETGLSRFDGRNFKNYTVSEGLPDNEILKVFADSRGRVWILPFKKSICYYFKNKIYNAENDSVLRKLTTEFFFSDIVEDEHQNIILADGKKAVLIRHDNTIVDLFTPDKASTGIVRVNARKNYFDYGFRVFVNDSAFDCKDGILVFHHIDETIYDSRIVSLISYKDGSKYLFKLPIAYITYENENNFINFINTSNGVFATDTLKKSITEHYLPGKKVSKTMEDSEKNLWFCTLGDGIYKLASRETKTINFDKTGEINNTEVFSVVKSNNDLICGLGFSKVAFVNNGKIRKIQSFNEYTLKAKNSRETNRLFCIKRLSSGINMLGFDSYLIKLENQLPTFKDIFPIKSIDEIDKDFILVGTSSYVFKLRIKDLEITDTIWSGRSSKVFSYMGKTFIGTLNGLYEINQKKEKKYLGELSPSLAGRITDIKSDNNNTLYIATADHGVVVLKNNQVIAELNESSRLSSNICRTLFLMGQNLFVGTNKGLNKIDLRQRRYSVIKYTVSDGLPSDIINTIYAENDTVWVGTPAGLTFFNEKHISTTNLCKTVLLGVTVSGNERAEVSNLELPYNDNNITFEIAGISFKSGGEIEYYYKLDGLDPKWNSTQQTILSYESLPYGNYIFQLYAVNKFGLKSNMINVNFRVLRPFWKNPWFYVLLFFGAIAFTAWIVNERNRKTQLIRNERHKIELQMITLEQQALQAQMNPHFIFNCLNSIQQYILTNDKEKANQFLTEFATLVRQTLDISDKRSIFLSEEIDYLNRYLQMEKMRFANNFNYTLSIDDKINPDLIEIPPLLHQPFVENSLRHGIRYKEHGTGIVNISFRLNKNILVSSIKDNGVGRQKANSYKSKQHIEYQSKGVKLTEKRIELINKVSKQPITFQIFDLKNEEGHDAGTEVKVNIPINIS